MLPRLIAFFLRLSRVALWLLGPIGSVLSLLWKPLQTGWLALRVTRASGLTVAAGALLLLTAQGRELAVRMRLDDGVNTVIWWSYIWFLVGVILFAFQAWYWARLSLEFEEGARHREMGWLYANLPRAYAGAVVAIAVWAHYQARDFLHLGITLGAGVILVFLLVMRRAIFRRLGWTTSAVKTGPGRAERLKDLTAGNQIVLWGSVLFSILILILAIVIPVGLGQWMGGGGIVFLAFSQIIPVVSLALIASRRIRVPIITTAFIGAAVFSLFNDNHMVEIVPPNEDGQHDVDRPGIATAALAWYGTPDGTAKPMIFISTAGGGLRAAYWTATVLAALEDTCPGFSRSVFSISGVSGGSVGAAVYTAALRSAPEQKAQAPCLGGRRTERMSAVMRKALSADFLGPTFTAMFYPDLVQRFLPLWRGFGLQFPDRGAALAEAWSEAWKTACGTPCVDGEGNAVGLDQPFLKMAGRPAEGGPWSPVLLLNGTHQETGKRFIASNVRIETPAFLDSFDMHEVLKGDVTLATAALNSARFTYVSPAGLLEDVNGDYHGHVLDGGYFENFGAVTSAEVAREAIKALERRNLPVRPIFIQISSDPALTAEALDMMQPPVWPLPGADAPATFLNEIAGPIVGLMRTREARGLLASKTLDDILTDHKTSPFRFPTVVGPLIVDFNMCHVDGATDPPLGWLMSQETERAIEAMLSDHGACGQNAYAYELVKQVLSAPVTVNCEPIGDLSQNLCTRRKNYPAVLSRAALP